LARNKVLEPILRGSLKTASSMREYNQSDAERVFKDFRALPKTTFSKLRISVGCWSEFSVTTFYVRCDRVMARCVA
jgi:hypothetical protein